VAIGINSGDPLPHVSVGSPRPPPPPPVLILFFFL